MNDTRPALKVGLSPESFKRFYWLKAELVQFCREAGLSPAGSKADLLDRIESYLAGRPIEGGKADARRAGGRGKSPVPIGPDTVLTTAYRSSEEARAFFKSVIGPHFHFSVRLMKYCRDNPEKTYGDAVQAWYAEQEMRKSGRPMDIVTTPECEYNRFVRAYLASEKGKTLADSARAWNEHKAKPREAGA